MSGASQQKKKHGNKAKRLERPASASGSQGASAGSAAAGHSAGSRAHSEQSPGSGPSHVQGPKGEGGVAETGGADGRATVPGGVGGGFGE